MRISIITLNYNGSTETIKLLKSLEDQTDKDFEIVVVDNASKVSDLAHLQEVIHIPTSQVGYPQVKLLKNSENLGFSGGNNIGIRQALNPSTCSGQETGSDWVVFLNNDTWVEKDFVERLRDILTIKSSVLGIPLIIEGNGVAYCGKIQWLKPTLIHITDIASRLSTVPTCDVGNPQVYAIGGAMAVHKDVFDKIGFWDEKYFLYFEDADFSIQAKKAGFDISTAENLNIHHQVSSSTKKLGSPLLLRYHYRNALYFNLKNGPWYIKFLVWPWSWIVVAKQLMKLILRKNVAQSEAILSGVIDFYKNKMGRIKTGVETS